MTRFRFERERRIFSAAPRQRSKVGHFARHGSDGRVPNPDIGQLNSLTGYLPSSRVSRARLRECIDQRWIVPVCQPIFSVQERRVVAVEALSRFPGTDGPDRWFAEARRIGMGVELELAAVAAALTLLPGIPAQLPFAVNASPETLHDPRLLGMLRMAAPWRLVVELTEHHPVRDYAQLIVDIDALRCHGVRLAIDDVGSGFSSFAHVIHLRPDFIKIDMSLVAGLQHDPGRRSVISAIVAIALTLDAIVVAEGVEIAEEMDALIALGVTCMQGFLFARPAALPLANFPQEIVALSAVTQRSRSWEEQQYVDRQRFQPLFSDAPIGMVAADVGGSLWPFTAVQGRALAQNGEVMSDDDVFTPTTVHQRGLGGNWRDDAGDPSVDERSAGRFLATNRQWLCSTSDDPCFGTGRRGCFCESWTSVSDTREP